MPVKTNKTSTTFPQLLKGYGFKRLKQHHKGIIPWEKDIYYVEVYNDNRGKYAWAIGGALKSAPGFPGGWAYWDPQELIDEFQRVGV